MNFVQVLAEGQEKVSDTSLVLNAIGSPIVTLGNTIFVAVCTDSQAGTTASAADSLGNTYGEASGPRQLTDFTVFHLFAVITVAGTLSTITITLANSNTAKAGVAGEYFVGDWDNVEDSETASSSTTVQATTSASANYDLPQGQGLIGALGSEGPGTDSYTGASSGSPARTTTIRRKIGTTGGAANSNVSVALADVIADVAIADHKLSATLGNARDNIGIASVWRAGGGIPAPERIILQAVNRASTY